MKNWALRYLLMEKLKVWSFSMRVRWKVENQYKRECHEISFVIL